MIDYHAIDTNVTVDLSIFARFPRQYVWTRMVTWLTTREDRTKIILAKLREALAAGQKLLIISPRRKFCDTLYYYLKTSEVDLAYIHGSVCMGERVEIIKSFSSISALLITTGLLALPVSGPPNPLFNSVHFVLPTTLQSMRNQLAAVTPLTGSNSTFSPYPTNVTYYVDTHLWMQSAAGKIARAFQKQEG